MERKKNGEGGAQAARSPHFLFSSPTHAVVSHYEDEINTLIRRPASEPIFRDFCIAEAPADLIVLLIPLTPEKIEESWVRAPGRPLPSLGPLRAPPPPSSTTDAPGV